jgi:hypothetical protein
MTTGSGIDMASVYAAKYRKQPDILRAAVMGQSPDQSLDSYTALNALRLVKEADMMAMAGQAQQPTSSPSLVAQALAPPAPPQGLGAMVPGAMGQAPQGMPPQGMPPQQRAPMPQPVMQAASGGLAGMPTPDEDYADGGIVAFQAGGLNAPAVTDDPTLRLSGEGEGEGMGLENLMFTSKGDPETYAALAKLYPGAIATLGGIENKALTPEEYKKVQMDEIAAYREAMGPNTAMDALKADITERKGERNRNLEEGKGVALLKAAYAVTQGNNWARAFAGAGAAFGEEYNRALQADKAEKRSIAAAEFNMADAQRKENLGLFKEGRAAADRAVTARQAAEKARLDKAKAYADAIRGGMNATKPLRSALGGAGGASLKDFVVGPETYLAQIKEEHPDWSPAKQKAEAFKLFQQGKSAGLQGAVIKADTATAQVASKENTAAQGALNDFKTYKKTAWKKYVADNGGDEKAAETAYKSGWMTKNPSAGSDDFDPNKAVDYIPTAKPAATSSVKPGAVLNYDANGKRIN